MNKISEILSQFDYEYSIGTKSFKNYEIDTYTTYKYADVEKTKVVAKYLIIDCTKNKFAAIVKDFEIFQKKLIADVFYSHRDDIRWNLYAFILVDNKDVVTKEDYDIEKDEDYARKFIFDIDDLKDFLKNGFFGQINSMEKSKIKTNFILEWDNLLNEYSLNGCMYNKMSIDSINDYVINAKPIRPIGRPLIHQTTTEAEDKFIIKQIKNIHLTNYRTHCFEKEFVYSPSLVNLISGSNGSGKSSICEAIALGMSGSSNKKNIEEEVKIFCTNKKDDEVILSSRKSTKESRELDLTWYGTTTTGSKSNLVENFSIFNYLQPNAIYNNSSRDLNELIQNLIYGEETTQYWKNIQNYREKFNFQKKNWKNRRQELVKEVDEFEKKTINYTNDTVTEVSYDDKYNILSEIPEDYKINEKLSVLNSINYSVSLLDKSMPSFIECKTFQDIIIEHKKLVEVGKNIKVKKSFIDTLVKEKAELLLKKSNNEMKLERLYSSKSQIEQIGREYNSIQYDEIDTNEGCVMFTLKYYEIKSKLNKLRTILVEYNDLRHYDNAKENDFDSLYEKANTNYAILLKEYNYVKLRIKEKQNDSELTKKILLDIFRFAKEYQLLHESNSRCPLCGHNYIKSINVEEAINNTSLLNGNIDSVMEDLIILEQDLSKKIRETKTDIEILENNRKKSKEIDEFTHMLKELGVETHTGLLLEIFKNSNEMADSLEKFLVENNDIMNFIIRNEKCELYNEFKAQKSEVFLSEFLKNKIARINVESFDILAEKNNIEAAISKIEKDVLSKENIDNSYEEYFSEVYEIEKIIANVYDVKSQFETFNDEFDIRDWCRSFYNLKHIFEENLKRESDDNYKKSLLDALKEKQKELFDSEEKLERCNEALKVFNRLASLEDNMTLFIMENAKRIEKIFKMIHRPEEFTDLVIKEGTIKFVRKTTSEVIDINNVSTGQALSLVFAVTICLHFSANKVPNLLIFDEPVANLDDVHIMNLVDILKEISLMGVQLFITTANDQVATFFRRKFSCLTDDFKHLEIQRLDENYSIFTEKIYSPNKETPNSEKLIAV